MRLSIDHLPKTARVLAQGMGLPATLALVQQFGGLTIWPHRYGAGRAALAEAIGEEAAEWLAKTFREEIQVPRCVAAIRAVARDEMREEFDRLTREGMSARQAVKLLARKNRITERWVWELLNRADSAGNVIETAQGELF